MANWGFKISIAGYDVKTATDIQLVMSSKFNMLKAKLVGTTTGNVAHELAYVPAYFAICKISTTKARLIV